MMSSEQEKEGEMRDFAAKVLSKHAARVCVRDDDVMRVVSHAALPVLLPS